MSEDVFDDPFNERKSDLVFLKVLVVLTFIKVVTEVIGNFSGLMDSGEFADQMDESLDYMISVFGNSDEMIDSIKSFKDFKLKFLENLFSIQLSTMALYLIEGFAALLMFNLKKVGFWIYCGVQIGFLVVLLTLYPADNLITTATIISSVLTSGLFCLLYGLNVKFMTK